MTRVAVYARVSTEKEDQKNSLDAQKKYFEDYVNRHENYELTNVYFDEGKTGTSTKKRKGFNQMISDAKNGLFDLIITKEVSRFARNTVDTLMYTRELKKNNIGVLFTIDNINTLDGEGELKLSLMATLAQEESRKTSERIKWGHRRKQENGFVLGGSIYGYDCVKGKLIINEEEAKVVRMIFSMYAEGHGLTTIRDKLNNEEIKTSQGKGRWHNTTISKLLDNEKYKGTLIGHKYMVTDYIEGKLVKTEKKDQLVFEKNHEAIVSEELWNIVQEEKKKRTSLKNNSKKYSNRYIYSGKIECPNCQSSYGRKIANPKISATPMWTCRVYKMQGRKNGCASFNYREDFLDMGCKLVLHQIIIDKNKTIKYIKNMFKTILKDNTYKKDIIEITNKLDKLKARLKTYQIMRADGEISKEDFVELSDETKIKITETEKLLEKYTENDKVINSKLDLLNKIENIITNKLIDIDNPIDPHIFELFIEKLIPIDNNKFQVITSLGIRYNIYKDRFRISKIEDCTVFIEAVDDGCILPFGKQIRYSINKKDINHIFDLPIFDDTHWYMVSKLQETNINVY